MRRDWKRLRVAACVVLAALGACGNLEFGEESVQQWSGGTCTGNSDVCHPVQCSYDPVLGESHCWHNWQQDALCNAICIDRGGGHCGPPTQFEVSACIARCRNDPNGVLCRALCYNAMPGYCEPAEPLTEGGVDAEPRSSVTAATPTSADPQPQPVDLAPAVVNSELCGLPCVSDYDCKTPQGPRLEAGVPDGIVIRDCQSCDGSRCAGLRL